MTSVANSSSSRSVWRSPQHRSKEAQFVYRSMMAEEIRITGDGDDEIAAYFASPTEGGPFPGVVVIHHMPGWDESTMEITRKFADHGYLAVCPNLHYREGPN